MAFIYSADGHASSLLTSFPILRIAPPFTPGAMRGDDRLANAEKIV